MPNRRSAPSRKTAAKSVPTAKKGVAAKKKAAAKTSLAPGNKATAKKKSAPSRRSVRPLTVQPLAAQFAAAAQLDGFLDRFTPDVAAEARVALSRMRARLPGAIELVYDNYNALAIGFSSTERASDAIFSIALFPRWVSLFFLQSGTRLLDPGCCLEGDGKQARHIKLDRGAMIDEPAVQDLIAQALELAPVPIHPSQPRRLIIKSISAKQRPRRISASK